MPTSIALLKAWDYPAKHVPGAEKWEPLPVRSHRASWKNLTEDSAKRETTVAEVYAWSSDHWQFGRLHGTIASETDWDELAEWIDETYDEIIPTLKEMAEQHPDAMWFVG